MISVTHLAYAVAFIDHTGYIPSWASSIGQNQALSVCSNEQYGTDDFKWCGEFTGYTLDQMSGKNSVTFVDLAGYIPSWASTMGQNQALSVCSNTSYGTDDFKWCGEFTGYTLDQMSGKNGADNTSPQSSSNIYSQPTMTMFSNSLDYDKFNSYRDSNNSFSITPPVNWVSKSTTGNTLASFWNVDNQHPAFLNIAQNSVEPVDFSLMTDQQILDGYINSFTNNNSDMHYIISGKNLYHYSDGIKIIVITTSTSDQGISTKGEIITYWLKNGNQYLVAYGSKLNDFDQYLPAAQRSIDTFYVSTGNLHNPSQQSSVPEFGPIVGMIITISIIGVIAVSRRFRMMTL